MQSHYRMRVSRWKTSISDVWAERENFIFRLEVCAASTNELWDVWSFDTRIVLVSCPGHAGSYPPLAPLQLSGPPRSYLSWVCSSLVGHPERREQYSIYHRRQTYCCDNPAAPPERAQILLLWCYLRISLHMWCLVTFSPPFLLFPVAWVDYPQLPTPPWVPAILSGNPSLLSVEDKKTQSCRQICLLTHWVPLRSCNVAQPKTGFLCFEFPFFMGCFNGGFCSWPEWLQAGELWECFGFRPLIFSVKRAASPQHSPPLYQCSTVNSLPPWCNVSSVSRWQKHGLPLCVNKDFLGCLLSRRVHQTHNFEVAPDEFWNNVLFLKLWIDYCYLTL